MKILTASDMKIAESIAVEKGSSYLELMEKAGQGAAQKILGIFAPMKKNVIVLAGKGNNGGDGLVVGRVLHEAGAHVTVLYLMGEELSPLSRANKDLLDESIPQIALTEAESCRELLRHADLIVDSVFGTGFSGELPTLCKEVFAIANGQNAIKVSLDLPSGMDCDNGFFDEESFLPQYTYTFGALKPAHFLKKSAALCGKVELIDIGIDDGIIDSIASAVTVLDHRLAALSLPKRHPDSNKGDYGLAVNIGGSYNMTGAMALSSRAMLRCGAGLVKAVTPSNISKTVAVGMPECIYGPMAYNKKGTLSVDALPAIKEALQPASAALIGCGMSVNEDTAAILKELAGTLEKPLVIDADGLNCLSLNPDVLKKAPAPRILTPHIKEMSRLTGLDIETIKKRRFDIALKFAREYNAVLVLKDSNTVIASPDGALYMNVNGNSGLSKGGSGDVLAGMITSFLAQGASPLSAAIAGVYLHALAGDIAAADLTEYAMLPSDIIDSLPYAFRQIL